MSPCDSVITSPCLQVLMFLAVPGHVIFLVAICWAESLGFPSVLFILFYLIAALCQVTLAKLSVCTVTVL